MAFFKLYTSLMDFIRDDFACLATDCSAAKYVGLCSVAESSMLGSELAVTSAMSAGLEVSPLGMLLVSAGVLAQEEKIRMESAIKRSFKELRVLFMVTSKNTI